MCNVRQHGWMGSFRKSGNSQGVCCVKRDSYFHKKKVSDRCGVGPEHLKKGRMARLGQLPVCNRVANPSP